MNTLNTYQKQRLHNVVEYVKHLPQVQASDEGFAFDVEDVQEDIHRVLAFYEIDDEFDAEELQVLASEFQQMAEQADMAESSRLAASLLETIEHGCV